MKRPSQDVEAFFFHVSISLKILSFRGSAHAALFHLSITHFQISILKAED